MTKLEVRALIAPRLIRHSGFRILSTFDIRHSTFRKRLNYAEGLIPLRLSGNDGWPFVAIAPAQPVFTFTDRDRFAGGGAVSVFVGANHVRAAQLSSRRQSYRRRACHPWSVSLCPPPNLH